MTDKNDHDNPPHEDDVALLITAETAAALCGVSTRTWRRLEETGVVPRPILLGRRMKRWLRADFIRWIEAGCPPRREWEARNPRDSA
jgi:predicted DNA-binding transcriptional regulator AlpA